MTSFKGKEGHLYHLSNAEIQGLARDPHFPEEWGTHFDSCDECYHAFVRAMTESDPLTEAERAAQTEKMIDKIFRFAKAEKEKEDGSNVIPFPLERVRPPRDT